MPAQADFAVTRETEELALRLLRFLNGATGDFEGDFHVRPHLCRRLNPQESVLGVCVTCGRLG